MFEFFSRLFGQKPSSETAKERLRLVLLSDHLSLAPDVVESLKHDLIEVISRYIEVDSENCDVTFEQQDRQVAMLANIPVLAMHKRPTPPPAPPAPPDPEPPPSLDPAGAAAAVADAPNATVSTPQPAAKQQHGNGKGSSRRRRRRAAGITQTTPRPQPT